MNPEASSGRPIEVRKLVEASQETAFEIWTQPEHIAKWWSPTATSRCTHVEIDLRVGGAYEVHMEDSADATTCKVNGEFQEVDPPQRLVYTWNAETHEGTVRDTRVTVEFVPQGEKQTLVILRHDGLPDTPIRDGHRETWPKLLDSVQNHVAEHDKER